MHKYKLISKKGEGTFSEVLKAQSIKTGEYMAIKCMKTKFDSIEQVNNLREIQALRRLSPHAHVVKLYEVLYDAPSGRLALVFELMERNIYELIKGRRHYLQESYVKALMYQLMKGIDHMHRNGIFHRDIKPENVLVVDDALKLADFGSCRGIYSKQPYTEYISTRWYRAPECLLTDGYYGYKMDIWGIGCIIFEVMALYPLFPGKDEVDQIDRVHKVTGTPDEKLLNKFKKYSSHVNFNFKKRQGSGIRKLIPHASAECLGLLEGMLQYDPELRWSAKQCLKHAWFADSRAQDSSTKAAPPAKAPANKQVSAAKPEKTPHSNSKSSRQEETDLRHEAPAAPLQETQPKQLPSHGYTQKHSYQPQSIPAASAGASATSAQTSSHSDSAHGSGTAYGVHGSTNPVQLKARRKKPHISKSLAGKSSGQGATMQQLDASTSSSVYSASNAQYPKQQATQARTVGHTQGLALNRGYGALSAKQYSSGLKPAAHSVGSYAYAPARQVQPTHPSVAAATAHAQKSYYGQPQLQSMNRVQGRHQPSSQLQQYTQQGMVHTMPSAAPGARQPAPYWSQQSAQKTSKVYSYTNAKPTQRGYSHHSKLPQGTPVRAPPRKKATNKTMRSKYPVPNFG